MGEETALYNLKPEYDEKLNAISSKQTQNKTPCSLPPYLKWNENEPCAPKRSRGLYFSCNKISRLQQNISRIYSHRNVFWGPEKCLAEEAHTKKAIRIQNQKDTVNTREPSCQYISISLH